MEALEEIAEDRPVIYPMHPRSRQRLEEAGWRARRVRLWNHWVTCAFYRLMTAADAVVTDSGGIQEETTVLGIPCFTLRANTERPITVEEGTNTVVGVGDSAVATLHRLLRTGPMPRDRASRKDGMGEQRNACAT